MVCVALRPICLVGFRLGLRLLQLHAESPLRIRPGDLVFAVHVDGGFWRQEPLRTSLSFQTKWSQERKTTTDETLQTRYAARYWTQLKERGWPERPKTRHSYRPPIGVLAGCAGQ